MLYGFLLIRSEYCDTIAPEVLTSSKSTVISAIEQCIVIHVLSIRIDIVANAEIVAVICVCVFFLPNLASGGQCQKNDPQGT